MSQWAETGRENQRVGHRLSHGTPGSQGDTDDGECYRRENPYERAVGSRWRKPLARFQRRQIR